ncbi:MAG: peptidoglycan-binding protein, partial [Nitrososphaera sp.]|nr:peptidoglycan-binding protein [Nitrososphaera sp.]
MKTLSKILFLFFLLFPPLFFPATVSAQTASFALSFTPSASSIAQGGSTATSINVTGETVNNVILAVSQGLPEGVTVKFSPSSCKAPCNSIMTVTATDQASPGTFAVPIIGAMGGATASASYAITVNALPKFNYSLSLSSLSGFVATGESISTTLNLDQLSGTSEEVLLGASGQPSGVSVKFSDTSCKPPCSATVTFTVSSVTNGTYPITLSATAGSITRTATYYLEVSPVPLSDFSLGASPTVNVILKGGAVSPLINLTQLSGTSQNVTLTIGNQIANATAKLSPTTCKPPCSAVLSIITKADIKPGTYFMRVSGSSGGITRSTEYQLIIIDPANPSAITPGVNTSIGTGVVTGSANVAVWKTLPAYTFNISLYKGSKGNDVEKLQQYLSADKNLYPEGLVTGYFGALTEKAVGRFQLQYGIITSTADGGYGIFGPKTRAKMNAL